MSERPSRSNADADLESLMRIAQPSDAQMLAARYAPIIHFDDNEPFLPLIAGYTIFRQDAPSPSYPRQVVLDGRDPPTAAFAIEYAVWWDWDIGHLYELEHVWVYVNDQGEVVRCEASWHGDFHSMGVDNSLNLDGGHPVVFSEPGKHAFAPDPHWFVQRRSPQILRDQSTRQAGVGGVWVTSLFETDLRCLRTPLANTLARSYLQRHKFEPALQYSKEFLLTEKMLIPWHALAAWIPVRVRSIIDRLSEQVSAHELHFLSIAHRGASAYAPENTLLAFRKAAELGANAVELDVQLSADGEPVVIHDQTASRLGDHRAVSELSFAQLRSLDAGDGERIPSLDEALVCCREEWLIPYIEIKDGSAVPAVVCAIQKHGLHQVALVGSFRPDWIAAVKEQDRDISTSILFGAPDIDPVLLAQAVGASYVHPCWESAMSEPHQLLTQEWIARVRSAGLGILLWHEERPAEIAQLRRKGVDGICSDAPDLLR